ncbi:hypothetical protein IFM89_021158, partial [Coptis chinensis]
MTTSKFELKQRSTMLEYLYISKLLIVPRKGLGGVVAHQGVSIYGATKGAINHLTKNLACEWAKDNIRSNRVAL